MYIILNIILTLEGGKTGSDHTPCPIADPGSMLSTIRHRVKLGLHHPLQKPNVPRPSLELSPVVDVIHSDGSAASGSYPPGAGAASGGSESSFNAQKGAVSFMQRIRTLTPSQQAADPEGPATPQQSQQRVPGERGSGPQGSEVYGPAQVVDRLVPCYRRQAFLKLTYIDICL